MLDEQDAGVCHLHVLIANGAVVGRVNLVELANAGSRAVLARTGFAVTGETVLNGRPAVTFARIPP